MVVTLFICHIFVVQRMSICQRSEKDCDNNLTLIVFNQNLAS